MHSFRKFWAVFGTVLPKRPITIFPTLSPPMVMSKATLSVTIASRSSAVCKIRELFLGKAVIKELYEEVYSLRMHAVFP